MLGEAEGASRAEGAPHLGEHGIRILHRAEHERGDHGVDAVVGQTRVPRHPLAQVERPRARHVVVYTWNLHPELIDSARDLGVHGYLAKTLPAAELVAAIEAVHAGEVVISASGRRAASAPGLDWPGRLEDITDRESEILALITQGKSNADVARLTYCGKRNTCGT